MNDGNENKNKADRAEVVFVSGVFEAVGRSAIYKSGDYNFGCSLMISQRDPQILKKFISSFGGILKFADKKPDRVPTFIWEVKNHDASNLAKSILPHLVGKYKKQKLERLIAFSVSKDDHERLNMIEAERIIDNQHRERLNEEASRYQSYKPREASKSNFDRNPKPGVKRDSY
ncbi:MAG: hypothetical protein ACRDBG_28300 [Waterburya sp.]